MTCVCQSSANRLDSSAQQSSMFKRSTPMLKGLAANSWHRCRQLDARGTPPSHPIHGFVAVTTRRLCGCNSTSYHQYSQALEDASQAPGRNCLCISRVARPLFRQAKCAVRCAVNAGHGNVRLCLNLMYFHTQVMCGPYGMRRRDSCARVRNGSASQMCDELARVT